MDPTTTFFPNLACPLASNRPGEYWHPFAQRQVRFARSVARPLLHLRTVFDRLRTAGDLVALSITLLAHGCPVQAIVVALGSTSGRSRPGGQCCQGQAVQEHLVEQPRDLGQASRRDMR